MKIVNRTPFWPLLFAVLIGAMLGTALGYFGQCTSGTCPLTSIWGAMGLLFGLSSAGSKLRAEDSRSRLPPHPSESPTEKS